MRSVSVPFQSFPAPIPASAATGKEQNPNRLFVIRGLNGNARQTPMIAEVGLPRQPRSPSCSMSSTPQTYMCAPSASQIQRFWAAGRKRQGSFLGCGPPVARRHREALRPGPARAPASSASPHPVGNRFGYTTIKQIERQRKIAQRISFSSLRKVGSSDGILGTRTGRVARGQFSAR